MNLQAIRNWLGVDERVSLVGLKKVLEKAKADTETRLRKEKEKLSTLPADVLERHPVIAQLREKLGKYEEGLQVISQTIEAEELSASLSSLQKHIEEHHKAEATLVYHKLGPVILAQPESELANKFAALKADFLAEFGEDPNAAVDFQGAAPANSQTVPPVAPNEPDAECMLQARQAAEAGQAEVIDELMKKYPDHAGLRKRREEAACLKENLLDQARRAAELCRAEDIQRLWRSYRSLKELQDCFDKALKKKNEVIKQAERAADEGQVEVIDELALKYQTLRDELNPWRIKALQVAETKARKSQEFEADMVAAREAAEAGQGEIIQALITKYPDEQNLRELLDQASQRVEPPHKEAATEQPATTLSTKPQWLPISVIAVVVVIIGLSMKLLHPSGKTKAAPPPNPPAKIWATMDLTNAVHVTWLPSEGAGSYEVWRNTSSNTAAAKLIQSGLTDTNFHDTKAAPSAHFYYWVKAANSAGRSDFGQAPAMGFVKMTPPATPDQLLASDELIDRIQLKWVAAPGAATYEILRGTANYSQVASVIADKITVASYDDTRAEEGKLLYYWVRARNTAGESGLCGPAKGYRKQLLLPSAPANAQASLNLSNMVRVSWRASAEATGYEIWRDRRTDGSAKERLATSASNQVSFDDITAEIDREYFYWVRAKNAAGESAWSEVAKGLRLSIPPLPPAGLQATTNLSDRVQLSWQPSARASGYEVWRYAVSRDNNNQPSTPSIIAEKISGTRYEDASAQPGQVYFYYLTARNSGGISDISELVRGMRTPPP